MAYDEAGLNSAKAAAVCHLVDAGMTDIADSLTAEIGEAILHIRAIEAGFDAIVQEYAADECPWVAGEVDAERAERWQCRVNDCDLGIYGCWKRLFIERGGHNES